MDYGPVVHFPILTRKDVSRAGWVIAAGLCQPEALPFFLSREKFSDKPIKCVREILKWKFQPEFPSDANLEAACRAVNHLWERQSVSGMTMHLTGDLKYFRTPDRLLDDHECIFAMAIFNDYSTLTEEEKNKLEPILLSVIQAAIYGAYKVIQRLRFQSQALSIPDSLRDPGRLVFLEDCSRS